MDEYIKREDAIRILRGRAVAKYPSSFTLGIFASADELKNMPAADVAPVVHGKWLECSNELNKYCSVCKNIHGTIYDKPPFCENCGADMRERRSE